MASRSSRSSHATAGDSRKGERLAAPIKEFGTPVADILVRRPFVQMQSLLDATQPKGRRYYWKSEYLPAIDPELCELIVEHAARIPSPHGGDHPVPDRRRAERAAGEPLPGREPRRGVRRSTSRRPGRTRPTTRSTSRGRARRGRRCGRSRRAAYTSTS